MMPAGKYVICDLCYVMDDEWDEVCSLLFPENNNPNQPRNEGVFQLKDGRKFALYGTAWGDGCYEDNQGRLYAVDAGVIGCIAIKDLPNYSGPSRYVHEATFDKDFETGYDEGDIYFGDIRIETDPKSDEYGEDDSVCQLCGHEVWSVSCHCDEEE